MKSLFILGIFITFSATVFARDSSHLVCTGYMSSEPDPNNYGFAVQFDESRSGASNRLEMLSSIWGGNLYQGLRLNKKDEFGKNGTVVMAAKEDSKKVFYKGAYNMIKNAKTGNYDLELLGQLNLDPTGPSSIFESISTKLECVDISN